jgi:hypothetical protein
MLLYPDDDFICLFLDIREMLGPISTCRPLPQVPKGVSSGTVRFLRRTGTCSLPREDTSKALSILKFNALCCSDLTQHSRTSHDHDNQNMKMLLRNIFSELLILLITWSGD